jgi:3-hydroxybutyryl-CoA dehydrogenase
MHDIKTICVCGAGTMGSGIAQICAQRGFSTILFDLDQSVIVKAHTGIEKNLEAAVQKGKLTAEEKSKTLGLIQFTSKLSDCVADLVIEAIIEKEEAKVSLFSQLQNTNGEHTLFASNTSSLSISSIAEKLNDKSKLAGLHFFNPAPLMRLVEVVRTRYNHQSTIDTLVSFAKQLGKTPVVCKDAPGFIVNHVARPYYLEALNLLSSGETNIQDIDELLESSGFKMGPFRLMDLIGNDVNYAVSCSVYEAMGKPERLKPSPIQAQKVSNGELGRKTQKGYYSY